MRLASFDHVKLAPFDQEVRLAPFDQKARFIDQAERWDQVPTLQCWWYTDVMSTQAAQKRGLERLLLLLTQAVQFTNLQVVSRLFCFCYYCRVFRWKCFKGSNFSMGVVVRVRWAFLSEDVYFTAQDAFPHGPFLMHVVKILESEAWELVATCLHHSLQTPKPHFWSNVSFKLPWWPHLMNILWDLAYGKILQKQASASLEMPGAVEWLYLSFVEFLLCQPLLSFLPF